MKEADPIEKAEKDFWKIIEEEKKRRDRKTALVRFNFISIAWLINNLIYFLQADEKAGAETGTATDGETAPTATTTS